MRAVNLLPREAIGRGDGTSALRKFGPFVAAGAVPVIAIGLVVIGWSSARSLVTTRTGELAAVTVEMPKVAHATPSAPDYSSLVAERTARLTALDDALSKEMPWDRALNDVARVTPPDVWLTDLNATAPVLPTAPTSTTPAAPTTAPATTTTNFTIMGYAYTNDDIAQLLARLELLPSLTQVALSSATDAQVGTKPVVQFTITAGVVPSAEGAGS